MKQDNKR